ncbi:MAG: homocysteine S-methyltransferase family protein [Planctomycetes bacterium]|nr:homocysteine S-methyltransferase family protein [Planctomycetota bacterium]
MTAYRKKLPQLAGDLFVTDGGIETTLVFHEKIELPEFAAFTLLKNDSGRRALLRYFRPYLETARRHAKGVVLETPTWRASADWGRKLGYDAAALAEANRAAVGMMEDLRALFETPGAPHVISGNLGPRGDGYVPSKVMSAEAAEAYHRVQIATFARTAADLVSAFTMNYVDEAVGIARAAQAEGMPAVLSFTVETDGRLPTGQTLREAVESTDAATGGSPAYYMINCAHPEHFAAALDAPGAWRERIRGVRANASTKSHAELNESTALDAGDPADLGRRYAELRRRLPKLAVLGGCCGTDHRHIEAMCEACAR